MNTPPRAPQDVGCAHILSAGIAYHLPHSCALPSTAQIQFRELSRTRSTKKKPRELPRCPHVLSPALAFRISRIGLNTAHRWQRRTEGVALRSLRWGRASAAGALSTMRDSARTAPCDSSLPPRAEFAKRIEGVERTVQPRDMREVRCQVV